ncbi:undecaprenyldiphospho-muramoylpentapeptide beta-N-acetylglucosaminyltransferase [Anaerolentibacter hominis]|uniref:undecaprenyldiphospho-muramoylpentapeptide beta-N-acetylglucosaminyltransferase n=1 Tax=Anaerolentibacter hominis TaxID=3079009 RepID=UPI0031B8AEFE
MKRIVLTGGGTAGHVTPNIALLPKLKEEGYDVHYIGSYDGIEKKLIEDLGIPYYGISSGKLRRYFDPKNFSDPFKVLKGCSQANTLLKKLRPDIVFSKGGFVAVPVVLAAKRRKIPAIIHESDMTPGLANRLCIPWATKICANFPETLNNLPGDKAVLTGSPIRKELYAGNKISGLDYCHFTSSKPVLMVIGGSLGAASVNDAVRKVLPELLRDFQVIHLCGKDKLDPVLEGTPGYVQFEYIKKELADLFAASDIVISRAGANAICELLALRKPNILIPLPAAASRGDQILNARSFERQGFSYVLEEEKMSNETLMEAVTTVYSNLNSYIQAMELSGQSNAIEKIVGLINQNVRTPESKKAEKL